MPSPSVVKLLVELGEKAAAAGKKGLADTLSRASSYDTGAPTSRSEIARLIVRARRSLRDTPVANALNEVAAMRTNPNTRGRSGTWDPEVARGFEFSQSAAPRRVVESQDAPARRASAKAERSRQNRERAAAHRQAKIGKSPEEQRAMDEEFDRETERLRGSSGRSIVGGANVVGGGRFKQLKEIRSKANKDINRRLVAGEIDKATADAEYAKVKQAYESGIARINQEQAGVSGMKTGDVRAEQEGAYYDTSNPEAMDRTVGFRGGQEVRRPGGLNEGVVTAAAVTRKHIEHMIATRKIPNAPPDAAMPGIIRTAMKELKLADEGLDDFALMRAYRQQARRGSAFSRRRPQGGSEDPIGSDDVDEVGGAAGAKLLADLRSGAKRQKVEEDFVDFSARELAAGDEVPDAGITGRELARRTAQAAYTDVPADASFRERESLRRGRGRATRQMRQFDRMDEGAGEYADRSNLRRRESRGSAPREPEPAITQATTGPIAWENRSYRISPEERNEAGRLTKLGKYGQGLTPIERGGLVRGPNAPPDQFWSRGRGGALKADNMVERPYTGEGRENLGVPGTFRSPHSGVEETPAGLREENIRRGRFAYTEAVPGQSLQPNTDDTIVAAMEDAQLMLDEIRDGQVSPEEATSFLRDLAVRVSRLTESEIGTLRGQTAIVPPTRSDVSWMYRTGPEAGSEGPTYGMRGGYDGPSVQEKAITDQADDDIDRLIRNIMRRVGDMPPQVRDQYFAAGPLDQQMMLNRQRSSSLRDIIADAEARAGDDVDFQRESIAPAFMGRQMPRERMNPTLLKMILETMGGAPQ